MAITGGGRRKIGVLGLATVIAVVSSLLFVLLLMLSPISIVTNANATSSDVSYVRCETTAGDFTLELHRDWAPIGYDRFMELINDKEFFKDQVIYRTIPKFLVQFGVASNPIVQERHSTKIMDDVQQNIPFTQGTISFAGNGKDSRSCHLFISLEPNGKSLGNALHERPFGRITSRKEQQVIVNFYSGYGDITHLQQSLVKQGNKVVEQQYPKLDKFKRCYVINNNNNGNVDEEPPQEEEEDL